MAYGQGVVRRSVACAKARAAKRRAHDGACIHEVGEQPLAIEVDEDRLRGRVYREVELVVAGRSTLECMGRFDDVAVGAAGASGDDPLLAGELAVGGHLVEQAEVRASLGDLLGGELRFAQDVLEVLVECIDRVGVGRVEG